MHCANHLLNVMSIKLPILRQYSANRSKERKLNKSTHCIGVAHTNTMRTKTISIRRRRSSISGTGPFITDGSHVTEYSRRFCHLSLDQLLTLILNSIRSRAKLGEVQISWAGFATSSPFLIRRQVGSPC